MEYKDIREEFVKQSGRYDLVTTDWQDNGADFFLNAGQRMLDRRSGVDKTKARFFKNLTAGDVYVATAGLLAIHEAWIVSSTARAKLERRPLSDIREFYDELPSELDQGTPAYYAPTILRPYPDAITPTELSAFNGVDDIIASTSQASQHFTFNGVFLMPPANDAYTFELWGRFGSPELSATKSGSVWTQTMSAWSENHPDILIEAALFQLEKFHRNMEGMKGWLNALDLDLADLDMVTVEQECAEVNQMEG